MPSLNKVILMGHLGRDPEVRYTPSGKAVANVSLATSETFKDSTGEKKETTTWHDLTVWGRMGEVLGEYCKKGSLILVEGKLQTQTWDDKDGNKRYKTFVNVMDMKMINTGDKGAAKPAKGKADDDIGF